MGGGGAGRGGAGQVEALGRKGWDYVTDEGGGAFYGPKIDIKIQAS
jgi:threonyl-tRNA synthetase